MSPKGRFRQLLRNWSNSDQVDPLQRLTSRCRENLRALHTRIHHIDVLAAGEILHFSTVLQKMCDESDPKKALFPEDNYTALETASTDVLRIDQDWDTRNWSFAEILGDLSKPHNETLKRWRAVATALERIQTRFIRVKTGDRDDFEYVEFCRARAQRFLDLANHATILLCVVTEELQAYYYPTILHTRERLATLSDFNSIWERLTFVERHNQQERGHHVFNNSLLRLDLLLEQDGGSGLEYNNALHEWDPTLIAVTMLVVISCVVLLALAWQHSLSSRGSIKDSGFFFLIQDAVMQALGIFTVMLPLKRRASYQAWKWAWFFAISGTMSLLASVVLYCLVQTWWAGLCTFVAAASQAAITLQVMLMVDSTWKEASEKRKNL